MTDLSVLKRLLHTCWPALVEINSAVFLAADLPPAGPDMQSFSDRTAAEAFYNHIHILDLLSLSDSRRHKIMRTASGRTLVDDISHMIVDMWRTKLQRDFPAYHFRLYLTREEEPILRFHVLRTDEPPWLDLADWQAHLSNGTLAIYDSTESGDHLSSQ